DVGDETHATGIVFIGGVVQTLLLGQIHLFLPQTTRKITRRGPEGPKKTKPNAHKKAGRARTGFMAAPKWCITEETIGLLKKRRRADC
ncbi:MAG: hypothetical protein JSS47_18535, partial [Proteobacteria bacterium]|nr:hypothetical protein [Pseudomonadota bacterium]